MPHLGLWRHLYWVKPQPTRARPNVAGGASFNLRQNRDYIAIPMKSTQKGYKDYWFYCHNHPPCLPPFTGLRPVPNDQWLSHPDANEEDQIAELMSLIVSLKRRGLTGAYIASDWLAKRLQPLKLRVHPAYEYSGSLDPTRESDVDLPAATSITVMNSLFENYRERLAQCTIVPYSLQNPRPEVKTCKTFKLIVMSIKFCNVD
jgi:hypothetical protein